MSAHRVRLRSPRFGRARRGWHMRITIWRSSPLASGKHNQHDVIDHMRPPFRSKQEVIINAPLETVWEFNMDITKIAAFHPRVVKVELLSGKSLREPGVSYRCHLSGGKHTCVEKDIEIVPMQKLVTVLSEDTFGISKVLPDYVVETTLHRAGPSTKIEISHYYSTPTLKAKLLNLIARRKIARDTQDTLNGMKAAIEKRGATIKNG
jgi:hypothetical protein